MFKGVKKFFFKGKSGLINSYSSFSFNEGVSFSRKEDFSAKSLKGELLDPSSSTKCIFSVYWNVAKKEDRLMLESSNFKCSVIVLNKGFVGREFNKSCSFRTVYRGNSKDAIFEVLSGKGYFLLESVLVEGKREIKLVEVKKGSKILVGKGSTFVLINSSEDEDLVCLSVIGKNTKFECCNLKKSYGAALFYTKGGFVRNENVDSSYNLEDYKGNLLKEFGLDGRKGLYEQILQSTDKFGFLK